MGGGGADTEVVHRGCARSGGGVPGSMLTKTKKKEYIVYVIVYIAVSNNYNFFYYLVLE
jgi:hypothetical protein